MPPKLGPVQPYFTGRSQLGEAETSPTPLGCTSSLTPGQPGWALLKSLLWWTLFIPRSWSEAGAAGGPQKQAGQSHPQPRRGAGAGSAPRLLPSSGEGDMLQRASWCQHAFHKMG